MFAIKRNSQRLDVQTHDLENGMTVILCPCHSLHRTSIMLNVCAGARDEAQPGTAHMLEHLIFRGSHKYPSLQALNGAFEDVGADFNAYTAREVTSFDITLAPESLGDVLELLAEAILRPKLQGIVRERSIIREEILPDYDADNNLINVDDLLVEAFYGRAGTAIAGSPLDVDRIEKRDVTDFYETHYRSERMVLVIVGPIPSAPILLTHIVSAFADVRRHAPARKMHPIARPYADALSNLNAIDKRTIPPSLIVRRFDGAQQSELSVGFLGAPPQSRTFLTLEILARILDDGLCSRLSRRLIEELALVYDAEAFLSATQESSLFQIRLSCRHRRIPRLLDAVYEILQELATTPVEAAEITRIKRRIAWENEAMLDSAPALGQWISTMALQGMPCDFDARRRQLELVTPQDILESARDMLQCAPQIVAIVGNIGEQSIRTIEKTMASRLQTTIKRQDNDTPESMI